MKSLAVVYSSNYGTAERYAQALAEMLGCAALPLEKAKDVLGQYDAVCYGAGLYASQLNGAKKFAKAYAKAGSPPLALFSVGITTAEGATRAEVREGLPESLRTAPMFHLSGSLDMDKLSRGHRSMMRMLNKIIASKAPSAITEDEHAIAQAVLAPVDGFDEAALQPLAEHLRSLL